MRDKLLNRFIGVMDDRDEYQQQEIFKVLSFSGMLLWVMTLTLMMVCLIADAINDELSVGTVGLLIINMVYASYTLIQLRRKQLDGMDCETEEEYLLKKKRLRKSSTFAGLQWGILMFIMMQYILPYINEGTLDVSWTTFIIWMVAGILFGLFTYWLSKSRLKKHY